MDVWDAVVAVISYIFGGLTVHLCYKYKKKMVNHSDNIIGGDADISAGGDSVVAKEYNKTVYVTGAPSKRIQELSEQAKNIMKQVAETGEERIVTFEQVGIVEELLFINTHKTFPINDKIAIPEDMNTLVEHGFLSHYKRNKTGDIYVLTTKGREYGKSLIS